MNRISVICLAAVLTHATPAFAFDCEFYQTCCQQLVGAYEEAGVPATRLQQFETTCHLHEIFAGMPGAQQLFCLQAWEAMSSEAYQHFQQGRIGFYPESCWADPTDDALEPTYPLPDPDMPEPDPEGDD